MLRPELPRLAGVPGRLSVIKESRQDERDSRSAPNPSATVDFSALRKLEVLAPDFNGGTKGALALRWKERLLE